uniref:hypothetical protein n=1 Tax=Ningiella ruwaisensis TaxID=2364274 RepID=UPI0010A084AA|nr:hypothetical protein [Ningiella ruwaisensis]
MSMQSSPDAFIQQQQKARAVRIRRLFIGLGVLLLLAVAIAAFLAFERATDSGKQGSVKVKVDAEITADFSSEEQNLARDSFKDALSQFEQQYMQTLALEDIQNFAPKRVKQISTDKERALALFANAAFVQALGKLNQARAEAADLINDWHTAYSDKLQEASTYYLEDRIQESRLALSQADKIKNKHPDSDELRSQLAAYDTVATLIADLEVARLENNLEKQVAIMQQILQADPTRDEFKAPLSQAANQLTERRLSLALGRAETALNAQDINAAQTYIQQARAIQANAKGIEVLSARLNRLVSLQSLDSLHKQIEDLKAQDAWQAVLQTAKRGLESFSQDAQLKRSADQANAILRAQQSILRFTSQPERIADVNIRQAAQTTLEQSLLLLSESQALAGHARTLATYIDQYSVSLPVTVKSDGQTFIKVIGVGVVGEVEEKEIQLTPGTYTFEGSRQGYRSKRVNLEVGEAYPNTITLVCDETI